MHFCLKLFNRRDEKRVCVSQFLLALCDLFSDSTLNAQQSSSGASRLLVAVAGVTLLHLSFAMRHNQQIALTVCACVCVCPLFAFELLLSFLLYVRYYYYYFKTFATISCSHSPRASALRQRQPLPSRY